MDPLSLLRDLNDAQKQAVTHEKGPLMIIAGAGTGKTTVITRRIAWLIAAGKADPAQVLALTFTEKAATEMEERVDRLLPLGYVDMTISTFHAFCEKVLRAHGLHIGLSSDFTLMTEVETWLLMRRNLDRFKLEYFRPRGNPTKFLHSILQHFSRLKDEGITAEKYAEFIENLIAQKSGGAPEAFAAMEDEEKLELMKWRELSAAYSTYETLLVEKSALDFGGLLLEVWRLFAERPNILKEYQEKFRYVIVDEFQDTNSIQYALVKMIAGKHREITVVGDDDQAIYKFRGAALSNILQFRDDFPETSRVVLTSNYRSGRTVLDAAHRLVSENNPHRLEVKEGVSKKLQSHKENAGFARHIHNPDLDGEVNFVREEIIRLVNEEKAELRDIAILSRANDSVKPFLEAFDEIGIPYRFGSLSGLYTKPVVLDALAYLRLIVDPYNGPALYRVLSHPRLGIDERDLAELFQFQRKRGIPLSDVMDRAINDNTFSLEAKNRFIELQDLLRKSRERLKRQSVIEIFLGIVRESGLLGDIGLLKDDEAQEAFRHLNSILARMKRYLERTPEDRSARGFLMELDAEREAGESGGVRAPDDEGPDVVSVMTVHGAKGLEFRYVFVVNLVEQRFPSVTRSEALPLPPGLVPSIPELDDHVAEERRLFYVAMTRAKEGLYLCSADSYGGTRKRKASRFIAEAGIETENREQRTENDFSVVETIHELSPRQGSSAATSHEPRAKNGSPKSFSFSQLKSFTDCPLQYKYGHVIKIPTPPTVQMTFGQSMHITMQRFLETVKERQDKTQVSLFGTEDASAPVIPPVADLLALYHQSFLGDWYENDDERNKQIAFGETSLKELHARLVANPPTPAFLEQGFSLKIGEVLVKGRIDRIDRLPDGTYEIIDYKSGRPKTTLEKNEKRQLILYAIAAEECFSPPLKVSQVSYHYFDGNVVTSFAPKDAEKEELKEMIRETAEALQHTDFPATPDQMTCKYCAFKDICPSAVIS